MFDLHVTLLANISAAFLLLEAFFHWKSFSGVFLFLSKIIRQGGRGGGFKRRNPTLLNAVLGKCFVPTKGRWTDWAATGYTEKKSYAPPRWAAPGVSQ